MGEKISNAPLFFYLPFEECIFATLKKVILESGIGFINI
jgi:hypothetical protein